VKALAKYPSLIYGGDQHFNPFSTEPVLQITLFFTCSNTGALICNYLLDDASSQGYTRQVIDQSASGCIAWSHYTVWLAYSSSNHSSSDMMC
jgi:hypothetical protein